MPVPFSKSLLRQEGLSKQEKFQVMQRRRARLTAIGKTALTGLGYALGGSLKLPGSHAFSATYEGKTLRIGMRTSSDRWLAINKDNVGGFGLFDKVDVLFIVAFDEWPAPNRIMIYRFDPKPIREKAAATHAHAEKHGHTGVPFLPLDDRNGYAGLAKLGEVVFDEQIVWTAEDNSTSEAVGAEVEDDADEIEHETAASDVKIEANTKSPIMEHILAMLSNAPVKRIHINVTIEI